MRSKVFLVLSLAGVLSAAALLFCMSSGRSGKSTLHAGGGDSSAQNPDEQRVTSLEPLGDVPDIDFARGIQFIDERRGWVSDQHRIWRTLDGAKSWHLIYKSPEDRIWGMQFVSASNGWIDVLGKMFGTTDGGQTWAPFKQPISPYPEGDLANFRFVNDGKTGWIVGGIYRTIPSIDRLGPPPRYSRPGSEDQGRVGVIFFSDDYGKTWERQLLTRSWGYLWNIFALDAKHAWVSGIPGEFYLQQGQWRRMHHGGMDEYGNFGVRALNLVPGGPNEEPARMFFLNRDEGWISNFNGHLAKSSDGGRTWNDLFELDDGSQIMSYFLDIYFRNSNDGWALSHQGELYRTTDGGRHWSKLNTGINAAAMFFLRPDYGLIIAKSGLFRIK